MKKGLIFFQFIFSNFFSNALLLCKMRVFEIFNMANRFEIEFFFIFFWTFLKTFSKFQFFLHVN